MKPDKTPKFSMAAIKRLETLPACFTLDHLMKSLGHDSKLAAAVYIHRWAERGLVEPSAHRGVYFNVSKDPMAPVKHRMKAMSYAHKDAVERGLRVLHAAGWLRDSNPADKPQMSIALLAQTTRKKGFENIETVNRTPGWYERSKGWTQRGSNEIPQLRAAAALADLHHGLQPGDKPPIEPKDLDTKKVDWPEVAKAFVGLRIAMPSAFASYVAMHFVDEATALASSEARANRKRSKQPA